MSEVMEISKNTPKDSTSDSSWLKMLYAEDSREVADHAVGYVKLLPMKPRKLIWKIAHDIVGTELAFNGIAGLACQLFERFVADNIRTYRRLSPESREWISNKIHLKGRAMMIVTVCIRLATKAVTREVFISTGSLQELLQKHKFSFSIKDINKTEEEVLKALDFRLPLLTNVDKAQMLSAEVGHTGNSVEKAGLIMDFVDYNKEQLQEEILKMVCNTSSLPTDVLPSDTLTTEASTSSSSSSPIRSNNYISNMHFIGGVVAATERHLSLPTDSVPKVARLLLTNTKYIKCIRKGILMLMAKNSMTKRVIPSVSDDDEVSKGKRLRCC